NGHLPRGNSGDAEGAGKPEPEAGGWPRRSARRSRRCQANRPAWIGRSSKAPSISYMEGALSYCARLTHPRPRTTRQQIVAKRGHASDFKSRSHTSDQAIRIYANGPGAGGGRHQGDHGPSELAILGGPI